MVIYNTQFYIEYPIVYLAKVTSTKTNPDMVQYFLPLDCLRENWVNMLFPWCPIEGKNLFM